MFLARRPSQHAIDEFIQGSQGLTLLYGRIGLALESLSHHEVDETIATVGRGDADFSDANHGETGEELFEVSINLNRET